MNTIFIFLKEDRQLYQKPEGFDRPDYLKQIGEPYHADAMQFYLKQIRAQPSLLVLNPPESWDDLSERVEGRDFEVQQQVYSPHFDEWNVVSKEVFDRSKPSRRRLVAIPLLPSDQNVQERDASKDSSGQRPPGAQGSRPEVEPAPSTEPEANPVAIAFAEWSSNNNWIQSLVTKRWSTWSGPFCKNERLTTAELFTVFQQQTKSNG